MEDVIPIQSIKISLKITFFTPLIVQNGGRGAEGHQRYCLTHKGGIYETIKIPAGRAEIWGKPCGN